ncbi:ABC transporter substrate-binding protein [Patescibacteria group bacterium]|nr:ABC transporter substrate-binding protein [Patescibacteria group bacterium]
MKKQIWIPILVVVIIIVGIILLTQNKNNQIDENQEPIKIGAILPLTGKIAQYAEEARRGIEIALEQEKDLKLEIIYEDSKSDAKEGVSAYQRLQTMDLPVLITGASPISLAISPLANQDEILQMGVFSSVADYSSPNDFTFRVTPRSEVENKKIASWAIEQGYKKFAFLYDNSPWGLGHYNFIKSEIEELGGEITSVESFLITDNDFRTQLIKIKNKNSEAIFILAHAQNAGMILKQAKELGLEKQFLGNKAIESIELLDIAGEAAEGIIYPYSFNPDSDDVRVRNFVSDYQSEYKEIPTTYVAEGYDAMSLIIKSIKQCEGADSQCMKNNLLNAKDYPGILGNMTFDENGDVFYDYFIKTVRNGQFVPYEQD